MARSVPPSDRAAAHLPDVNHDPPREDAVHLPEPSPAARRASGPTGGVQTMLHCLHADQTVHLAGLYAQGQRCLTLHHPDVTTVDEEGALLAALDDLEVESDQQVVRAHTATATTWWWDSAPGRHADDVVHAARTRLIRLLRPGWSLDDQP